MRSLKEKKPLLLVVEDNADMRSLVAEICQPQFKVLEAADGLEGLELIRKHRPTLVISDVMMPRMDGQQMLREVRADPEIASTPLILLTARTSPSARLEGLEGGADDYLSKPFDSRELLARARILVRLKQQEEKLLQLGQSLQEEVVSQVTALTRARTLARFLPPEVARSVMDGELSLDAQHQRRRLTVFMLQLRGFEAMVDAVDAEDLAVMLQGYLSEMMEIALEHGATVDRLVRDRVVGFFGAPTSQGAEQDALLCARMAHQMWQQAQESCKQWHDSLNIRPPLPTMVITSGHAFVGTFGSTDWLEYTAIGGAMDEAVNLLPLVGTGELACSQATWTMIRGRLDGQPCGEMSTTSHETKGPPLFRLAGPIAEILPEAATMHVTAPPSPALGLPGSSASDSSLSSTPSPGEMGIRVEPGTLVLDRYRITRELGSGGMGAVLQADDLKLSTTVALKVLRGDLRHDTLVNRKRFYREVRLARLLNHRNIAKVYGIDEWKGIEIIIMEFVEGKTLSRRLKKTGSLPLDFGRRVLLQLCAGLEAAHASGIAHCDLKPSNIIIEPGGRVVLLDFGIARWLSSDSNTITRGLEKAGTPHYMAPERLEKGEMDHRSDIYSLGVVAYEMFSGQRIFPADGMAEWGFHHVHTTPVPPQELVPDMDSRLATAIMTCLEKRPEKRFQTAAEIRTFVGEGTASLLS